MLNSQKVLRQMSEKRQRINQMFSLKVEERAENHGDELSTLTDEMQAHEIEYRAALTAEDESGVTTIEEAVPADPARADLEHRARLSGIVSGIMSGRGSTGAEAELQAELGLDGDQVPLALLAPTEHRAAVEHRTSGQTPAPSNTGASQQPIIPAVFPQAAASFLEVDQPTVPVGDATFTVLSTSLTAGTPAGGASQATGAGAFTATVLSPKRIQGGFFLRREDKARLDGMESSLRENLSMALADKFDSEVIGAFLATSGGLTARTGDAAAEADFDTYRGLLFDANTIDGRYAATASAVKLLFGPHAYNHAATKYRGNQSDDDALASLMASSAAVRVSAHVPDPSGNDQDVIVRLGARRDAVAPIWDGVQLITDEVTQAKSGEIVFTAVMLWGGLSILRSAAFQRRKVQVA